MLAINPAQRILEIADHVIAGEIAFRQGKVGEAAARLRQAMAIEDDLIYMEPPEWTLPVRHTLGAILMHAERHAEAEQVYRADLAKWPENGWSLFGLAKALRASGDTAEANRVEQRFQKAWSKADTKITFTCLGVREKLCLDDIRAWSLPQRGSVTEHGVGGFQPTRCHKHGNGQRQRRCGNPRRR